MGEADVTGKRDVLDGASICMECAILQTCELVRSSCAEAKLNFFALSMPQRVEAFRAAFGLIIKNRTLSDSLCPASVDREAIRAKWAACEAALNRN